MNITFVRFGYMQHIIADSIQVGEIRRATRVGIYVLSFRHIFWASRSGHQVVRQLSHRGMAHKHVKLRPQPYGQSCIHVRSLKLAKYIAEQVAKGYPHLLFGGSK